jgi:hypothetical protein
MAFKDMAFHGNVVPMTWYHHLTLEDGKPNLPAIIILSDIVYWYRPVEIRDEATGMVVGYRAKFKADQLQRNYDQFAEQFGFTKRQAKDAINYLISRGLITREFRTVPGPGGSLLGNVMFVQPLPEAIQKINQLAPRHPLYRAGEDQHPSDVITPEGSEDAPPYDDIPPEGDHPTDPPMTFKRQTLTESTTETPTQNSVNDPSMHPGGDRENEKPNGDGWMDGSFRNWEELCGTEQGRFLYEAGVRSLSAARELIHIPLEVMQAEWERVQVGTARDKAATLILNLRGLPPLPAAAPAEPAYAPAADQRRPDWVPLYAWAEMQERIRDMLTGARLVDGQIVATHPIMTEMLRAPQNALYFEFLTNQEVAA